MDAAVADVSRLEGGVRADCLLESEVPLPGVGKIRVWIFTAGGAGRSGDAGWCCAAKAARVVVGVESERSVGYEGVAGNAFTLKELTASGTNDGLAGSEWIPDDANAGSDVVITVLDERTVWTRDSAREVGAELLVGRAAGVGARSYPEAVAGVRGRLAGIVQRGLEAGDLIFRLEGLKQERVTRTVVQCEAR